MRRMYVSKCRYSPPANTRPSVWVLFRPAQYATGPTLLARCVLVARSRRRPSQPAAVPTEVRSSPTCCDLSWLRYSTKNTTKLVTCHGFLRKQWKYAARKLRGRRRLELDVTLRFRFNEGWLIAYDFWDRNKRRRGKVDIAQVPGDRPAEPCSISAHELICSGGR